MALYLFRPLHEGWKFQIGQAWIKAGEVVELEEEQAAERIARIPGKDDRPCLLPAELTDPVDLSAKAKPKKKPTAPKPAEPGAPEG